MTRRWFTWGPQWGYGFPIRLVRGTDEHGWNTIGVVTWAGSLFIRTTHES